MRPRYVTHELLKQFGCRDGAAPSTLADVFDVGDLTLDLFTVFRKHRQLPGDFANLLAGIEHPATPIVVVRHRSGHIRPQSNEARSSQRRQVDNRSRLLLDGHIQHIG